MKPVLSFCVEHARGVVLVLIATVFVGLYSFTHLPIDAVPDISPVQVQVNTLVKGLAPEEVEKQVTFPLETELGGVPGMEEIRSLSKFGLSQITLIFRDGTDLFRARQMISEKIQAAIPSLPADVTPRLAPMVTGLGEIVFYTVDFKTDARGPDIPTERSEQLMELKRIHDLFIKPRLRSVPGVAEINTVGGKERQLLVLALPDKMAGAGLSFREIRDVMAENTENAGGGILSVGGEQVNVRANTRVNQPEEVATLAVKTGPGATALRLSEVAEVQTGSSVRVGAATWNGREALLGTVMMLAGENPRIVARAVEAQIKEISPSLPPGVEIRVLSNRADLVDRTIATVRLNLTEGAVIVIVVLLFLLGNFRAALIVSLAIPLSFLLAVTGMVPCRISGNLMSLGAVDFGLIVDGSVVMVENILRRLRENQHKRSHPPLADKERSQIILNAAQEVASPMCFGVMIVTIVYVPILALGGIEGKMFHPMALTVMLALFGSLFVALLGMPALCRLALRGFSHDHDPRWLRSIQDAHRRLYEKAMQQRRRFLGWTVGVFIFSMGILAWMDKEFLPRLDEGAIAVHMIRAAGVSLDQALIMQQKSEKVVLENMPEVAQIYSKIGTDEAATDPMGVNIADSFLILRPRSEWKGSNHQKDVAVRLSELLQKTTPGQSYILSQPIEMRFNEILEGTRADISVKIFGDDFTELERIGNEIREVLEKVPGTGEVEFDTLGKAPVLEIQPDRQAMLAYQVHAREINEVIATALGGSEVGAVIRGNQRIPVVVRLPEHIRNDLTQIRRLPVPTEDGGTVPLENIAVFKVSDQVNAISRETGQRRIALMVSLKGGTSGWVVAAQKKISKIDLPKGYRVEMGGQFKHYEEATQRLRVVVPMTLGLILILLFAALKSFRHALLVLVCVPTAVTGGILALALRGMPLTISAVVGFLALSGIAVLNGVMLITYIQQLRREGLSLATAIQQGTFTRLRPMLMTASVAAAGFFPMALSTGAGAEVQRPLATVVIGGIITSTFLTLVLLPVLFLWIESSAKAKLAH